MRIERNGPTPPLTPKLVEFLTAELSAVSLDLDGDVEKRPDYECLRGLLLVEMKSLEGDPTERLENAVAADKESEAWPKFYGSWPMESVLKNLPNAEEVRRKTFERLSRAIVTHVKKANDQLREFSVRHPRRNRVRMLILVNEDYEAYSPDAVGYAVAKELSRRNESGAIRNADIDVVVYFSERHATEIDGLVALPVLIIPGFGGDLAPWKVDVAEFLSARWTVWNGATAVSPDKAQLKDFGAVEDIPRTMKRHELWSLEYRRRRYMRKWTDDELRDLWDAVMLISMLAFHKEPPMRPPQESVTQTMERFTHLQEEIAMRGIPLPFFSPEPERMNSAIDRLPYGPMMAEWLRLQVRRGEPPHSA